MPCSKRIRPSGSRTSSPNSVAAPDETPPPTIDEDDFEATLNCCPRRANSPPQESDERRATPLQLERPPRGVRLLMENASALRDVLSELRAHRFDVIYKEMYRAMYEGLMATAKDTAEALCGIRSKLELRLHAVLRHRFVILFMGMMSTLKDETTGAATTKAEALAHGLANFDEDLEDAAKQSRGVSNRAVDEDAVRGIYERYEALARAMSTACATSYALAKYEEEENSLNWITTETVNRLLQVVEEVRGIVGNERVELDNKNVNEVVGKVVDDFLRASQRLGDDWTRAKQSLSTSIRMTKPFSKRKRVRRPLVLKPHPAAPSGSALTT
uniref:Uncharacterized protein n=2 Tax=Phaeomonas parva TaxID=124430 RepID=A0A6U4HV09_9STRA|mmetsp:Transcript_37987/g.119214  ORF Transcript_37987/g.119214 Transcript_37987/m.119214 type:complete len:329 (+) Transcript_37987:772-1758(+)